MVRCATGQMPSGTLQGPLRMTARSVRHARRSCCCERRSPLGAFTCDRCRIMVWQGREHFRHAAHWKRCCRTQEMQASCKVGHDGGTTTGECGRKPPAACSHGRSRLEVRWIDCRVDGHLSKVRGVQCRSVPGTVSLVQARRSVPFVWLFATAGVKHEMVARRAGRPDSGAGTRN